MGWVLLVIVLWLIAGLGTNELIYIEDSPLLTTLLCVIAWPFLSLGHGLSVVYDFLFKKGTG